MAIIRSISCACRLRCLCASMCVRGFLDHESCSIASCPGFWCPPPVATDTGSVSFVTCGSLLVGNLRYTDFTPTVQSYGCSLVEHGLKDVRPCQRPLSRLMKVTSATRRKEEACMMKVCRGLSLFIVKILFLIEHSTKRQGREYPRRKGNKCHPDDQTSPMMIHSRKLTRSNRVLVSVCPRLLFELPPETSGAYNYSCCVLLQAGGEEG
jgi:hypothetical protein